MLQKFLEVGQVVGTHGIAGEMRVQPWCDSPDFLTNSKHFTLTKTAKNLLKFSLLVCIKMWFCSNSPM